MQLLPVATAIVPFLECADLVHCFASRYFVRAFDSAPVWKILYDRDYMSPITLPSSQSLPSEQKNVYKSQYKQAKEFRNLFGRQGTIHQVQGKIRFVHDGFL